MANKLFTSRDGTLRFYDSTATPNYIECAFDGGDLNGPLGRKRPEEKLILDKGKATANAHYIAGPDDPIFEPLPFSFTAKIVGGLAKAQYLRQMIAAMNDGGTTTVQAQTLVTTKGDSTVGGITTPAFADSNKLTMDLELILDNDASDWGIQYQEAYIPADQCKVQIGENESVLSIAGLIFGAIDPELTAFTAGSDISA